MTNLNGWIQKDACCKAFSPDCQSISELYSRQSIFGCIDIQNGFIFNAFVVQKSLNLPCSRRKMLELGRRNGQQKIESYAQTYLLQLNQCCWGQRKSCATPIICQRPLNHGKQRDLLRYLSCECTERNRSHQLTLEVPWTWHIYCKSMRCYLLPAWKVEQLMRRCTDFRTGGGLPQISLPLKYHDNNQNGFFATIYRVLHCMLSKEDISLCVQFSQCCFEVQFVDCGLWRVASKMRAGKSFSSLSHFARSKIVDSI